MKSVKVRTIDLKDKLSNHMESLANMTDEAKHSEKMAEYLDFCSQFHQYSAGNLWLIYMANPDASYVAGYRKWLAMGRQVQKGEKGIPIIAPCPYEDKESGETKLGFRVAYVWDVTQTDGEPLPEQPDWKSPEKDEELSGYLVEFAELQGCNVLFKELSGEIQGMTDGKNIFISPLAGTKTIIHEIAHSMMHFGDDREVSWTIRELEAESVAYVVAKHFDLANLKSPNYIALCGAEKEDLKNSMDVIIKNASKIIKFIEDKNPIPTSCVEINSPQLSKVLLGIA